MKGDIYVLEYANTGFYVGKYDPNECGWRLYPNMTKAILFKGIDELKEFEKTIPVRIRNMLKPRLYVKCT